MAEDHPEAGLVDRAKAGDLEAFTELARLWIDRLYVIARLILRDNEQAEDATQEALIAAWKGVAGLRDEARFESWLRSLLVPRTARPRRSALLPGASRPGDRARLAIAGRHGEVPTTPHSPAAARDARCRGSAAAREWTGLMTSHDELDRRITARLDIEAARGAPDHLLGEVVERAARTWHLPAWATSERWIPMETRAQLGAVPRTAVVVITVTLLGLAGLAIALATSEPPVLPGQPRNGLIAFDARGDICVVQQDGSELRRLTETSDIEISPQWAPNGERILYWRRSPDPVAPGSVVVADAEGEIIRILTSPDGTTLPPNASARWHPDGRTILADGREGELRDDEIAAINRGDRPPPAGAIVLFDAATGDGRKLEIGGPAFGTRWSPDGALIAWPADDGTIGIEAVAPDGTQRRAIGPEPRLGSLGGWFEFTPDSRSIVFEEKPPGATQGGATDSDIKIIRLDGTEERIVAGDPANEIGPSVSPQGDRVAFERTLGGTYTSEGSQGPTDLYVVPIAGGEPMRVNRDQRVYPGGAIWSPDGEWLATWTPTWEQVVVFRADGSGTPAFIPSPENVGSMSWQVLGPERG
jgi:Sigma-70 region 2/WD40-like Beta Propeller Repeat